MSTSRSLHQNGARLCHTCGGGCELRELGADHYWVCLDSGCGSTFQASSDELVALAGFAAQWDAGADAARLSLAGRRR